jgi:hypothetical protein
MRKLRLTRYHAVVLYLTILLTTISIIGGLMISGLLPFPLAQASGTPHRQLAQVLPPASASQPDAFSSAVRPKLTECFNCGIVVDIRPAAMPPDGLSDGEADANWTDQMLSEYLNAHQKNARLLAAEDFAHHADEQEITIHVIDIRMLNGNRLQLRQDGKPQHRIGDRVRIIDSNTIST